MKKTNICSECGDEKSVYPYVYEGPNGEEVMDLCERCYIESTCVDKCGEGFVDDDSGMVCCLLLPTGETVSGWFGENVETYWKVQPSKCPKKMLDIL